MLHLCPLPFYQQELRVGYKRRLDRVFISANTLWPSLQEILFTVWWAFTQTFDGAPHPVTGFTRLLYDKSEAFGEMVSESLTLGGILKLYLGDCENVGE